MKTRLDAVDLLTALLLVSIATRSPSAQGGTLPVSSCCPGPASVGPCCIGQWDAAPYNPPISCERPNNPQPDCTMCGQDEIAHAALIPCGEWAPWVQEEGPGPPQNIAGMVLVWTKCALSLQYSTRVWDPANPGGVAFSPPILDRINADATQEDSPFCSGHAWILDDQKNPKLLTVGGEDWAPFEDQIPGGNHDNPCNSFGTVCGLHKVYWFDPLASNPHNAWSDTPADLTDGRWYPSVTTYLNAAQTQFLPIILDGTPHGYAFGCGPTYQHSNWWTLDRPLTNAWTSRTSNHAWNYYARPFQLKEPEGLLMAGHAIVCEDEGAYPGSTPFGGNPSSRISPSHVWSSGPSPNPDDTTFTGATGGGWNYSNGVILHTLNSLAYTEVQAEAESRYDLDRVIIAGGSQHNRNGSTDIAAPAQPYVHELVNGVWQVKASPSQPRVYANWVILPDRTVLLVGGASNDQPYTTAVDYYATTERFTPQGPLDPGFWRAMASRPDVVVSTTETLPAPGRGYHSLALLLQDGRVALMGGSRPLAGLYNRLEILPWSRVEIYSPGYTFESTRLVISGVQSGPMAYGSPYYLTVNRPSRVSYASLIGISSVTHSFDYGQRYVQLMATNASGPGNVKVLGPPVKTSAPEGYYLLFVVEIREGVHIPSKGVFVKLVDCNS